MKIRMQLATLMCCLALFNTTNMTASETQSRSRFALYALGAVALGAAAWHLTQYLTKPKTLFQAAESGDLEAVKALLENTQIDINAEYRGRTPLHYAAQNGHIKVIETLLNHGAEIEARSSEDELYCFGLLPDDYMHYHTPLHLAIFFAIDGGSLAAAELLLKRHAHVDATDPSGRPTLHHAITAGHIEAVKLLLSYGATTTKALHCAAENGHVNMINLLLDHDGTLINKLTEDSERATPLYYAAQAGRTNAVKLLLTRGADYNLRNFRTGMTPLHIAVDGGHSSTARALLEAGAPANIKAVSLSTPLHYAQNKEIAKLLLDHGADAEATNVHGDTPLKYAASSLLDASRNRRLILAQFLVEQGALLPAGLPENTVTSRLKSIRNNRLQAVADTIGLNGPGQLPRDLTRSIVTEFVESVPEEEHGNIDFSNRALGWCDRLGHFVRPFMPRSLSRLPAS